MNPTPFSPDDQVALWNGRAGRAWVEEQAVLDDLFRPFERLLVETVLRRSARRVLDVGCGTGATTLAIARVLGAAGSCLGADLSEPMIAVARARARRENLPAEFLCADAEGHGFEAASFDLIVSRFGVMFFADPVRAFANFRRAAAAGAGLEVVTWRSAAENPFMTTAERAVASWLPHLPARRPGAPGQFAFADRERVSAILASAGWVGVECQPLDVACAMPERELPGYATRLGPVGLALQDADDSTRTRVIEKVRTAFEPFVAGGEVRFTAACWKVTAHAAK